MAIQKARKRANRATRIASVALAAVLVAAASMPAAGMAAERVDLNSATAEQLVELPGVGPAKAQAIIEERGKAPFGSVEDLERVKGIGPASIAELREHVKVSESGAN